MKKICKHVRLIYQIFLNSYKYDYKITVFEFLHGLCLNLRKVINVFMPAWIINMIVDQKGGMAVISAAVCYGTLYCVFEMGQECFKLLQEAHGFKVINLLRLSMNQKFMRIDYADTESAQVRDAFEQAKESVWEFNDVGYVIFVDIVGNTITFCCMSYILADIHTVVYGIVLFLIFLAVLIQHKKAKFLHDNGLIEEVIKRKLNYISELMQNYQVGKEIRLFHTQEFMKQRYQKQAEKYTDLIERQERKVRRLNTVQALLYWMQLSIVYLFAIGKFYLGKLPIGSLLMYIASVNQLTESIKNLLNAGIELSQVMSYYKDYESYMDIEEKQENMGGEPVEESEEGVLEFRDVTFFYPGSSEAAVKHVSFVLRKNQKVGIVGENGSGKSTLVKLMLRLYVPTYGNIYLNGKNINTYQYREYLNVFKTVFQDFAIFSYSILENIVFDSGIDEKKLREVLQIIGLDRQLSKYEKGINSMITKVLDDEGVQLSGGEQQLVAIARAFYHPSRCIVFDEPTAALDARREAKFFELIRSIADGKMTIFCAHRMSSTKFCDSILVMEKGEILERGNHEALMAKKGKYYDMFEKQASLYKVKSE